MHKVKALDELIIFAIHGNFPRRLFRAVEDVNLRNFTSFYQITGFRSGTVVGVKLGWNMQKITFFLFQVGMWYGVGETTARVSEYFSTLPDPSPLR